jgi:hypothetical protein
MLSIKKIKIMFKMIMKMEVVMAIREVSIKFTKIFLGKKAKMAIMEQKKLLN